MTEEHWSTPIDEEIPGGLDVGCASCAFRRGSPTRYEPYNAIRAKICALGGVPFYCHDGFDGPPGDEYRGQFPPGAPRRVCCGWKAEVAANAKQPWWRDSRSMRQTVARIALIYVDDAINSDGELKGKNWKVVQCALNFLTNKKPKLGALRKRLMDVRP